MPPRTSVIVVTGAPSVLRLERANQRWNTCIFFTRCGFGIFIKCIPSIANENRTYAHEIERKIKIILRCTHVTIRAGRLCFFFCDQTNIERFNKYLNVSCLNADIILAAKYKNVKKKNYSIFLFVVYLPTCLRETYVTRLYDEANYHGKPETNFMLVNLTSHINYIIKRKIIAHLNWLYNFFSNRC